MELILGLILAAIVFLLANGLYKVMNRPKITPIDLSEQTEAALVVIDMQEDFTRQTGKMAHDPQKLDAAIAKINELAAKAHDAGIPVIEVSHAFTAPHEKFFIKLFMGGAGVEGSKGLRRDEALTFKENINVWKDEGDSFTSPMFARFLKDHKIGHLILTGQDATACVNATANGALKRNFAVTLVDDAILARNESKWSGMRNKLMDQGAKVDSELPA